MSYFGMDYLWIYTLQCLMLTKGLRLITAKNVINSEVHFSAKTFTAQRRMHSDSFLIKVTTTWGHLFIHSRGDNWSFE